MNSHSDNKFARSAITIAEWEKCVIPLLLSNDSQMSLSTAQNHRL